MRLVHFSYLIILCVFTERSFPTHRSLMGDSPEAIEGQAKLFRVLTAYAKYNPQIGYSQGETQAFILRFVFMLQHELLLHAINRCTVCPEVSRFPC